MSPLEDSSLGGGNACQANQQQESLLGESGFKGCAGESNYLPKQIEVSSPHHS